ncbi:hypothetical protein MD484_g3597, partial [Candolleomyces efflorescens]
MSVAQSNREIQGSEDIEARQALLSEENQPASPADPTGMPSNSRADEARSRGDTTAGTIALASVGFLTVSTWIIIFTHNPTKLGWFAPHPLLQTLGLSLITYGQYAPLETL